MNAGQSTARRLASKAASPICRSCREAIPRNAYSTAAVASAAETPSQSQAHVPPVTSTAPQTSYGVQTGVVLSRPPIITRDLHPFESAFFLYQRRLNERLALPFTESFYIKRETPEELAWNRKIKERLTPARDIGRYSGQGEEAWNDEVLVGAKEHDVNWQVERLLEDAEKPVAKQEASSGIEEADAKTDHDAIERPMPRITEADLKGDVKSLNRSLQRTLYLLVKNKDGKWGFPADRLQGKEQLHAAAERILTQAAGVNMNTWLVGRIPIGHYQYDYPSKTTGELGLKTFFMKARIMAGQANLKGNQLGLSDFKWLAKEEVKKEVEGKRSEERRVGKERRN